MQGEDSGYFCHLDDNPACPEGSVCVARSDSAPNEGRCEPASSGGTGGGGTGPSEVLIPKTGAPYTGNHSDPKLTSEADCPDDALEPNGTPGTAVLLNNDAAPVPDEATGKLVKMAICPAGSKDNDYYLVDTTSFGLSSLTLMAEIFYDISYGDLDVAIYDSNGRLLSSDGTSVTNGCTTAQIGAGVYYVVVTGANNVDVNRYDAHIRTFTASRACPTSGSSS